MKENLNTLKEKMNTLKEAIEKRNLKLSRIAALAGAALAVLLALAWLMPVAYIGSKSYTMMEAMEKSGQGSGAAVWMIVIFCGLSAVWLVMTKRWAAFVGAVYSILPMILCIAQVSDWKGNNLDLAIGGVLLVPLSLLVTVLAVARLVLFLKEEKEAQANGTNEVPPTKR